MLMLAVNWFVVMLQDVTLQIPAETVRSKRGEAETLEAKKESATAAAAKKPFIMDYEIK